MSRSTRLQMWKFIYHSQNLKIFIINSLLYAFKNLYSDIHVIHVHFDGRFLATKKLFSSIFFFVILYIKSIEGHQNVFPIFSKSIETCSHTYNKPDKLRFYISNLTFALHERSMYVLCKIVHDKYSSGHKQFYFYTYVASLHSHSG